MPKRKRWRDLSPKARAMVVALGATEIVLAGAAWTDLSRRPAHAVRGSKRLWRAVIGINIVGPIAYFRWGRVSPAAPPA